MFVSLLAALSIAPLGAQALAVGDIGQGQQQKAQAPPTQQTPEQKHADELKNDAELGKQYSATVEKENKISKDKDMIERANRVAGDLAAVVNANSVKVLWGDKRINPYQYQVKVIEGKDINAFSLPGGYIYLYEGLMKYVETDDELAGVLAHEMSHCSQRHVATLMKEQSKFDLLTLPLVIVAIFSGSDAGYGAVALKDLANVAGRSGWSQKAETSADNGAFQIMQKTKYNPVGLLTFMERLARDQRGLEAIDWGIFRTHPPSRERAEAITKNLREAKIPIKRSLVTTSFRVIAKTTDSGEIELHFNTRKLVTLAGKDAPERAEEAQVRLNDFFDSVPELYQVGLDGNGTVLGNKRVLIRLTKADADAGKTTVEQLSTDTVQAIRRGLYMLAFRIWDARYIQ